MDRCFVMQPFDGGRFDKRYNDVFSKAISDAGLEPYRVDQDPKVSIPIQDIETGIKGSKICFAEITNDNPNVWFELGYAIASGKEVVLACSEERETKFPFDIQHRSIIKYKCDSSSDYDALRKQITTKINAYIQKGKTLPKLNELLAKSSDDDGLASHEKACLAILAENLDHPESGVTPYQLKTDMERSGFNRLAGTLAIKSLLDKDLMYQDEITEWNSEPYLAYKFTPLGWSWILENQHKFTLEIIKKKSPSNFDKFDDDIPF